MIIAAIGALNWSRLVAVSCCVAPISRLAVVGDNVIVVKTGGLAGGGLDPPPEDPPDEPPDELPDVDGWPLVVKLHT